MRRTELIFAVAALVLIVLGFISRPAPAWSLSISSGRRGYALPYETPFLGLAALFCGLAFLYSIAYIPFSRTMTQWHPWLSIIGIVFFGAALSGLRWVGSRPELPPTQGPIVTLIAVGYLGGTFLFVGAQLWFTFGLMSALVGISYAVLVPR